MAGTGLLAVEAAVVDVEAITEDDDPTELRAVVVAALEVLGAALPPAVR